MLGTRHRQDNSGPVWRDFPAGQPAGQRKVRAEQEQTTTMALVTETGSEITLNSHPSTGPRIPVEVVPQITLADCPITAPILP